MQFIHPLMLWGAAAATVPVVIHLIHRRRFRRQRWAAMEWLLEAVKQNQRRLQMENLLLLAVRTLAVLLLALAIARPTFSELPSVLGQTTRSHLYVLLDNSGSMAARSGTRSGFDDALAAVSTLVAGLADEDPVSLVLTNDNLGDGRKSGRPKVILRGQTDHGAVRRRLGELKPAPARADLAEALKLLEEAVPSTDSGRRRVAIVTDLQETSFPAAVDRGADDPLRQTLARLREKGAEVLLTPVGHDNVPNVAVTSLRPADDRDVVQGSPAIFQAEVRNYADRPQQVEVRFLVDGEQRGDMASQWITVPARTAGPDAPPAGTAQYYTTFDASHVGVHTLTAEIRSDALTLDDRRTLAFQVRPRIQVLAVDPDLRGGERKLPETYFLALALAPKGEGPFQITQMSEADFHGLRTLDGWDLVVLANVERPAPDDAAREKLERFVEAGGGLFLSVGDHVVAQRWNEELHGRGPKANGLLPVRLGEARVDKSTPFRLDLKGSKHALLRNIVDEQSASWFESPFLSGRFTVEGLEGEKEARVALAYDDLAKSPALVEKRFGRGRVLLFTSVVDDERSWDGIAGSYVFPALVHEAAYWLTFRGDAERNLTAFQPWTRAAPPNLASMEVTRPDGSSTQAELSRIVDQSAVTFDETDQLGPYKVLLQFRATDLLGGTAPPAHDRFAVNLSALESDVRRRTTEEMTSRYREFLVLGKDAESRAEVASARAGEIATPLLAAALACLLVEVWLVQRIGRRRRR
jgi:hypothetical protein